jgi:hypothetical protein
MRFIGNVEKDAQVRAVASGALSTGDTVVVNSDGTVSVVEGENPSQNVGTAQVFNAAYTQVYPHSTAYDPVAKKIVVIDRNANAFVGEVGDSSVTYQSAVNYNSSSAGNDPALAFDSVSGKFLIIFCDTANNTRLSGIVGTVSGTSITFGSKVAFQTSGYAHRTSCAYDANSGKFLVVYADGGNSNYGTAVVATISGTNVSFGTAAVFESDTTQHVSTVYDITNQKTVITYAGGDFQYGYARVATISGTSVSFGSRADTSGGGFYTGFYSSSAYDPDTSKVVNVYANLNNSTRGESVVGTVSGTGISFGSSSTFDFGGTEQPVLAYNSAAQKMAVFWGDTQESRKGEIALGTVGATVDWANAVTIVASNREDNSSLVYDENAKRLICLYRDSNNSNYGTSVVFTAAYNSTNLTSENYIGFADSGYADGQSAAINSTCTVDRNQSGLTAGQKYYVQTDGSLGTTAADPSVVAGTAISSTEIIVKG